MRNIWKHFKQTLKKLEIPTMGNYWETFADTYDMNKKFESNKAKIIKEVSEIFEVYLKKFWANT